MEENKVIRTQPENNHNNESVTVKAKGFWNNHVKKMSSARQIFLWYLIISLTGALLLWLPFTHKEGMSVDFIDALFVSSSAFSDTGLSTVGIYDTFNFFGQLVTLILLNVGGVGWFTIKIFILTWILRRKTMYNDIADGSSELGTVRKDETMGLIFVAIVVSVGSSLIFGFIFSLIFQFTGVVGIENFGQALWTGIYHASTSVNNSGLDIFAGDRSMAALYGVPGAKVGWEVIIQMLTMGLFILGGIGFGIIYDIYRWFKHKTSGEVFRFSVVTKFCIVIYVAVAFVGLSLAYLSEGLALLNDSALNAPFLSNDYTYIIDGVEYSDVGIGYKVWTLTFNTFSTRNAGFSTMNLGDLQASTRLTYSIMMFIGSGPGSTAGGLRTTTTGVLIVTLWAMARNKPQVTAFGRAIPKEVWQKSLMILATSLFIVTSDIMLITIFESTNGATDGLTFMDHMFVVFSAYGTTGLSTAPLAEYTELSKLTLIVLMFVGQMGISTTLMQVKTKQIRHQRQYVEEYVNLG